MTLLITVFAAIISTVIWYSNDKARKCNVGVLCYMFWGASIMWFVDAVFEYYELRELYFTPAIEDVINDSFLGLSVIALALIIWLVILLARDPMGTVRKALVRK